MLLLLAKRGAGFGPPAFEEIRDDGGLTAGAVRRRTIQENPEGKLFRNRGENGAGPPPVRRSRGDAQARKNLIFTLAFSRIRLIT